MTTNLAIAPDLLEHALAVSGEKTKKAVVTKALEEFIARREQRKLFDLMGQVEWDETHDYKADRLSRDKKYEAAQQEHAARTFEELRALSAGVHLEGDIKATAREGLD